MPMEAEALCGRRVAGFMRSLNTISPALLAVMVKKRKKMSPKVSVQLCSAEPDTDQAAIFTHPV